MWVTMLSAYCMTTSEFYSSLVHVRCMRFIFRMEWEIWRFTVSDIKMLTCRNALSSLLSIALA